MRVYLDNSATSYPKPPQVVEAMNESLQAYSHSPGRSGHAFSLTASRQLFDARESIARFFKAPFSEKVIFTANATLALNMAFKGFLKQGDHVIISHFEHNSVYRPLRHMERNGIISISIAPYTSDGYTDTDALRKLIRPETRMIASIHGSNVSGAIQPVHEMGNICRDHGLTLVLDAAQTAGFEPIDMISDHIDILVFTGHKKLYGPTGIGGICLGENIELETFVHGGSGSSSELDTHPAAYPDRLEAGTPNTLGIIGLKAGFDYITEKELPVIRKGLHALTHLLIEGLGAIPHLKLYGPEGTQNRLPLVSLNIAGMPPSELARLLDRDYGIMARPGLHCAPLAHKALGSFPQGTLRLSPGTFTTEEQILYTIDSLKKIAQTP